MEREKAEGSRLEGARRQVQETALESSMKYEK
jgi:hypothetical protein